MSRQQPSHLNVTLASTLLDLERDHRHAGRESRVPASGIRSLDSDPAFGLGLGGVCRGGRIVGIGDHYGREGDRVYMQPFPALQLTVSLLKSHLLSTDAKPSPSVFIIAPPTSQTVAQLFSVLVTHLSAERQHPKHTFPSKTNATPLDTISNAESAALEILESVSVIQFFDLTGFAQIVSEIASLLRGHRNEAELQAEKATDEDGSNLGTQLAQRRIIFIEGLPLVLSQALSRTHITAGPNSAQTLALTQTAALTTTILRDLQNLVRENRDVLALMQVEFDLYFIPSSPAPGVTSNVRNVSGGSNGPGGGSGSAVGGGMTGESRPGTFVSAFADEKGRSFQLTLPHLLSGWEDGSGQRVASISQRTAATVMTGIQENALDGVIAVHDGFGKVNGGDRERAAKSTTNSEQNAKSEWIVEILKDRSGSGRGKWGVWENI